MVTKHNGNYGVTFICSVLAKILMVTKLVDGIINTSECSVLAKILMVTKQ